MLVKLASFVVVVAGIMAAKPLIIPLLLAIFMAIICSPPLYWLRTNRVPTTLAIFLLVSVILTLQLGLTTLITASLAEFTRGLPQYQDRLDVMLQEFVTWLDDMGINLTAQVVKEQFDPGKLMRLIGNMLNNLLALLTNTFLILLTFIFILLEAAGIPTKLRVISGGDDHALDHYAEITNGVNRYLGLKVLTSLTTGVLVGAGLTLIGVDFALMWGVIAFVLNFIPTIGSIIAAIPPILLALVQLGIGPACSTAVLYLCINIGISNFIEPRVMGSGVKLSTLIIFVSMAFWGWVLGPVGMLLSVPLTMTLKIAMANNEKTRGIAVLLGSNREAATMLKEQLEEKNRKIEEE